MIRISPYDVLEGTALTGIINSPGVVCTIQEAQRCLRLKTIYEEIRRLWGRGGLMVSALDSGASAPGSSPGPGRGHCVVCLGKTLHSHSASLHPGV